MRKNQEIVLNLLEEQVLFLIEDINYQREKEYLRVLKLKKEISKFYKTCSLKNKSAENKKIQDKVKKIILIIEKVNQTTSII